MKNAEKYAKQIAGILADSAICPVTDLISSQSPDVGLCVQTVYLKVSALMHKN